MNPMPSRISMTLSAIALAVGLAALWLSLRPEQVYVIDNKALFEGFELTHAYESKLKQIEAQQVQHLDSLDRHIRSVEQQLESEPENATLQAERQNLIRHYQSQSSRFRQHLGEARDRFDQNIWSQIGPLMERFARAKGYAFLVGKARTDDLYHYPAGREVTAEALEYLNNNYSNEE